MKENKIIAAAIKDTHNGKVFVGARHNNVMHDMIEMHGYEPPVDQEHHVQGFIDIFNKFHDRIEAQEIAIAAGQRKTKNYSGLYSEDLY